MGQNTKHLYDTDLTVKIGAEQWQVKRHYFHYGWSYAK